MAASSLGRRRPRPVADAPVLDGAALAKAWLVELVAVAPLERAAAVPGPRFAEDAPRLCAAVAAALASEPAFDDLEPGGALAPLAAGAPDLAAARDGLEAIAALEALRAVAWTEIVDALHRPPPAAVAELADRLAAIVATLAAAALESTGASATLRPGDRGPLAAILRNRATPEEPRADEDAPPDPPPAATAPLRAAEPPPAATRAPLRAAETPPADPAEPPPLAADTPLRAADPPGDAGLRPPADDEPDLSAAVRHHLAAARAAAGTEAAPSDHAAQARLRAAEPGPFDPSRFARRPSDGPLVEDAAEYTARRVAPWTAAIERRLARHRQDGLPFGVLCVEFVDLDRLAAADRDGDVAQALETAEAALCTQLRPADALVREKPGRYWITSPDTDGSDARALAHRIAGAVAASPPHRGAALEVAIGLASCPGDAADALELEGRAEEGLFSARAAGTRVAPA